MLFSRDSLVHLAMAMTVGALFAAVAVSGGLTW